MRISPLDNFSETAGAVLARPEGSGSSMPESEETLRGLKASESAQLAFAAAGISNPPPALANIVAAYVKNNTKGIPASQIAGMSAGSGELAAAAATAVNMAVSGMKDNQREAMQRGDNTLSLRDMAALRSLFYPHGAGANPMGGQMNGQRETAASSGARFDDMASGTSPGNPSNWITPQGHSLNYMRSYALQQGLGWATNYHEILRMGPEAVKALADVHLQEKNYKTMKDTFSLTPKESVETAKRAKKEGVNLNATVEALDELDKSLPPQERPGYRSGVKRFLPRLDEGPEKRRFEKSLDGLEQRHPHLKPKFERVRRELHLKQMELDATKKAEVGAQQTAQGDQQAARNDWQAARNDRQIAVATLGQDQEVKKGVESDLGVLNGLSTPEKAADASTPKDMKEPVRVADAGGNKATERKANPANTGSQGSDEKPKNKGSEEPARPQRVVQAKLSSPKATV